MGVVCDANCVEHVVYVYGGRKKNAVNCGEEPSEGMAKL